MQNWRKCKLGEISLYVNRGITPKYVLEGGTPIINQKCIREGVISRDHIKYHDSKKKIPLEKELKNEDILINSTGVGTAGRVGFVKKIRQPLLADSHITILRINPEKAFPEFVFYNLRGREKELENYAEGSTGQTELGRDKIKEITILLPQISEQKRTAHLLQILDDKIELNAAINRNLEEQAKAIFKSWFIDLEHFNGKMPNNWREGVFGDVISGTLGGDWGKDISTGNNSHEVYCIRGTDIPDVNLGNKGKMPIRYILPKNYSTKKLADGDIVIEISGGSPTQSTGRCALITQSLLDRYNRGMVCTNFCRAIKPLPGYSFFLSYYWKCLYEKKVMFSYENGTTGIKNFDIAGFLETEHIIIPPIEIINQFTNILRSYNDKLFANGLENEILCNLRDTLLSTLMSGKGGAQ